MSDPSPSSAETPMHCAVVGVVGRTNSGKSTLINQLIGEKITIVSPVVQTTRNTIRGIVTDQRGQLILLDTPGLHKSESTLGTLMNRMARHASAGVDILAVVFDASEPPQLEDDGWMRRSLFADQPTVFILNKSDTKSFNPKPFHKLWQDIQQEKELQRDVHWITTSSIKPGGSTNVTDLMFSLALPATQLLFPEDIITDFPRKLAIADIIREKFLARLHQEIPHELGVRVDHIEESPQEWRINATVFINRPSQKGIVIGPKGRVLRYVREQAEPELSDIFEVPVKLELWVKVEKNWMKNFWILREMGYAGTL